MQSTNSTPFGLFIDSVFERIVAGADHIPDLLAALLILLLGWGIARLVGRSVQRLAMASNRLLERAFPTGIFAVARVSPLAATLLREIVFWVILLVVVTIAAGVAGLSTISEWLDRITTHLPNLFAGVAVVVVAYFLGVYVREHVTPQAAAGTSRRRLLLGRVAQGIIVIVGLIVGLDQIGIDVALLVALSVVCVAALLTGLAVAFSLGARGYVSNLIGVRTARQQLSVGVRIRVDEKIEGEILEITPTQIALNTDLGKLLLPGRVFDEQPITIIAADSDPDANDV